MKRALDLLVASVLFVASAPLTLVISLILAFTGERQVIYGQARMGRNGREFRILKFTTMRKCSHDGKTSITLPDDPRVLPLGRFLRKTKLNELPQLFNVIRGDMTLVGPRPQPRDIFAYYTPEAQARISSVRPGVTGIGSVVFRDEERLLQEGSLPPEQCHREIFAPRKAELETWYVENQNLVLDFKLLLLTAIAIFSPSGRAYELGFASLGLPTRLAVGPEVAPTRSTAAPPRPGPVGTADSNPKDAAPQVSSSPSVRSAAPRS